jgi:hypothetical protein
MGLFGGVTIDLIHQQFLPDADVTLASRNARPPKIVPEMRRCNINRGRGRRYLLTAAGVTAISMVNVDARMTPCFASKRRLPFQPPEPHVSSIPMSP